MDYPITSPTQTSCSAVRAARAVTRCYRASGQSCALDAQVIYRPSQSPSEMLSLYLAPSTEPVWRRARRLSYVEPRSVAPKLLRPSVAPPPHGCSTRGKRVQTEMRSEPLLVRQRWLLFGGILGHA